MEHIVVIGAGQAGSSLTSKLRNSGFDGQITLIGAEPELPYQRPPLSKKYLLGDMERAQLFLRPQSFYDDNAISLRLGTPVTAIDRAAQEVVLDGERLSYDKLALTVGLPARRLPAAVGGELEGVFVVKTLADIDALGPAFEAARRVLIVGGGYIGLEAAAVAATKGRDVTLLEVSERILSRVASPETSDLVRALHAAHGVDIREGIAMERLTGETHVTGARLSDGSTVAADLVIAGIGLVSDIPLAAEAGLEMDNGIAVNAHGQTSDPAIWAAGDCASFLLHGTRMRLESVQNAIDMAEAVAGNMLGADTDYTPVPWFWSDQFDAKLQIAGLGTGYDQIVTRKGDKGTSLWYFRAGQFLAVDALNAARDYMVGKRLLEMGKSPVPDALAAPETDLKAMLK